MRRKKEHHKEEMERERTIGQSSFKSRRILYIIVPQIKFLIADDKWTSAFARALSLAPFLREASYWAWDHLTVENGPSGLLIPLGSWRHECMGILMMYSGCASTFSSKCFWNQSYLQVAINDSFEFPFLALFLCPLPCRCWRAAKQPTGGHGGGVGGWEGRGGSDLLTPNLTTRP